MRVPFLSLDLFPRNILQTHESQMSQCYMASSIPFLGSGSEPALRIVAMTPHALHLPF